MADATRTAAVRAVRAQLGAAADEAAAEALVLSEGLALDAAQARAMAREAVRHGGESSGKGAGGERGGELEEALRLTRALFPGLDGKGAEKGPCVAFGDSFKLRGAGCWIAARSAGCLPCGAGQQLCAATRAASSAALRFSIQPLQAAALANGTRPVNFGEAVLLVSSAFRRRVKLVCPGRSGAVRVGDHAFVVVLDREGRAASTLALAPTQRRKGEVPLQLVPVAVAETDTSPLCVTIADGDTVETRLKMLDNSLPTFAEPPTPKGGQEHPEEDGSAGSEAGAGEGSNVSFSAMVYNTWMMPRFWGVLSLLQRLGVGVSYCKGPRARMIPGALERALDELGIASDAEGFPDVIVLCEAFCDVAGPRLKAGLKRRLGLVFETPVAGSGPIVETHAFTNSGVSILSRYPIVEAAAHCFKSDWAGDDALANKSAQYVRVCKGGRFFNVFGAHLQAWEYPAAVRAREGQLLDLRRFVHSQGIARDEPVILAGDLNVCRARSPDQYERMLDILGADDPFELDLDTMRRGRRLIAMQEGKDADFYNSLAGGDSTSRRDSAKEDEEAETKEALAADADLDAMFTFNAHSNTLAMGGPSSGGANALLDYTLFSRHHRLPSTASFTVLANTRGAAPFSWGGRDHVDLSDHYPVLGRFSYD